MHWNNMCRLCQRYHGRRCHRNRRLYPFPLVLTVLQRSFGLKIEAPLFALRLHVFLYVLIDILLEGGRFHLSEEVRLGTINPARFWPHRRLNSWRCRRLVHSLYHLIVNLGSHDRDVLFCVCQPTNVHTLCTTCSVFGVFRRKCFSLVLLFIYNTSFYCFLPFGGRQPDRRGSKRAALSLRR